MFFTIRVVLVHIRYLSNEAKCSQVFLEFFLLLHFKWCQVSIVVLCKRGRLVNPPSNLGSYKFWVTRCDIVFFHASFRLVSLKSFTHDGASGGGDAVPRPSRLAGARCRRWDEGRHVKLSWISFTSRRTAVVMNKFASRLTYFSRVFDWTRAMLQTRKCNLMSQCLFNFRFVECFVGLRGINS